MIIAPLLRGGRHRPCRPARIGDPGSQEPRLRSGLRSRL